MFKSITPSLTAWCYFLLVLFLTGFFLVALFLAVLPASALVSFAPSASALLPASALVNLEPEDFLALAFLVAVFLVVVFFAEERTQSSEATTSIDYQENDYVIAARTGYFNQAKNAGNLNLYTEGGNAIPKDAVQAIPDLDPTLVKAVAMQESHLGTTGVTDIMQANVPGDWSALKSKYGLTKGESTSATNSLYGGIRLLATKGFKGGTTYDKKTGISTFTFQGWGKATGNYNGGGVKNYQENVTKMQDNATTPDCTDYTDECK